MNYAINPLLDDVNFVLTEGQTSAQFLFASFWTNEGDRFGVMT